MEKIFKLEELSAEEKIIAMSQIAERYFDSDYDKEFIKNYKEKLKNIGFNKVKLVLNPFGKCRIIVKSFHYKSILSWVFDNSKFLGTDWEFDLSMDLDFEFVKDNEKIPLKIKKIKYGKSNVTDNQKKDYEKFIIKTIGDMLNSLENKLQERFNEFYYAKIDEADYDTRFDKDGFIIGYDTEHIQTFLYEFFGKEQNIFNNDNEPTDIDDVILGDGGYICIGDNYPTNYVRIEYECYDYFCNISKMENNIPVATTLNVKDSLKVYDNVDTYLKQL